MDSLFYPKLRISERFAFAGGADSLPRFGRAANRVVKPEAPQHVLQIVDMHLRSKSFSASRAMSAEVRSALLPIKPDTDLRGALDDMKEFSEGKIQKARNDRHRVKDRKEGIEISAEPRCRNRQGQACYGNRRQQDQGEEVITEGLGCLRALIAQAAPQRKNDTGQNDYGSDIESMKQKP
jgi:hypothetical protein